MTIYLTEPEETSTKTLFTTFKQGDKVRLDPKEISGSKSFEGEVDLDKVFTVVSVTNFGKKNPSRYQILKLDSKVVEGEDSTGWTNSWFIPA